MDTYYDRRELLVEQSESILINMVNVVRQDENKISLDRLLEDLLLSE